MEIKLIDLVIKIYFRKYLSSFFTVITNGPRPFSGFDHLLHSRRNETILNERYF